MVDEALNAALVDMYLDGAELNMARYLYYAVKWVMIIPNDRLPLV